MLHRRVLVCLLGLAIFSSAGFGAEIFPIGGPSSTEIGGNLPGYECSGTVWHTGLEKLFVVDDDGNVASMDADGTNVNSASLAGDLEGICVADPSSDFVYIGLENPDSILEYNIVTEAVTRTFDLTTWMTGPNNEGLEALTFVPDTGDSEGGLFYAGLQEDGKIYRFRLSIETSASLETVTHISTITPVAGRDDISGLHYDSDNEVLYAIFDSAGKLTAMEADGTVLDEWDLPDQEVGGIGHDQEGITMMGNHLYIAQDSGEFIDYTPFTPLPEPATIILAAAALPALLTRKCRRRRQ